MKNPGDTAPPAQIAPTLEGEHQQLLNIVAGYREEAKTGREVGPSPRDETWRANWDRYWGRYDFSKKAAWQSKHVLPETPQYVDRWAAAMREALDALGEWYVVQDDGKDTPLAPLVKKVMDLILGRCARTPDGHVADFSSLFEEQMKQGAITAICTTVIWDGYVGVQSVDPREYWGDPKLRNLYRRRLIPMDKYQLMRMAVQADDTGKALYNRTAIDQLMTDVDEKLRNEQERSTGHSDGGAEATGRTPIKYEEWLGTFIAEDGRVLYENALMVVANEQYIIRGPEENPFWHGQDWTVFTPMVTVPLSFYGRTYMEDWSATADAFVELTNLILDSVYTSATKTFVANPAKLQDPTRLMEGVSPNAVYLTTEDVNNLDSFMKSLDLGTLPAEALQLWDRLKNELREGAKLSEIALGQMAPHSRTTKAEIQAVSQSGSSMVRSMTRTIETRWLEPTLTLVWKTALQHQDFMEFADVIGEDAARMFNNMRYEFATRRYTFRVRGLSGAIDRQARLQALMQALSVISNNQLLAQALMQQMDPAKLLESMFQMFGVDKALFTPTHQEMLMRQLTTPGGVQNAQQSAAPASNGGAPSGAVVGQG